MLLTLCRADDDFMNRCVDRNEQGGESKGKRTVQYFSAGQRKRFRLKPLRLYPAIAAQQRKISADAHNDHHNHDRARRQIRHRRPDFASRPNHRYGRQIFWQTCPVQLLWRLRRRVLAPWSD